MAVLAVMLGDRCKAACSDTNAWSWPSTKMCIVHVATTSIRLQQLHKTDGNGAGTFHQSTNCCCDESTYNNADDDTVAGKIVAELGRVSLASWAGRSNDSGRAGVQKSAVSAIVSTSCRSCLQLAAPASTQQDGVQQLVACPLYTETQGTYLTST